MMEVTIAEVTVAEVAVADDCRCKVPSVSKVCGSPMLKEITSLSKLDGVVKACDHVVVVVVKFEGIFKFVRCDCFLMLGRKPTLHAERDSCSSSAYRA